MVVALTLLVSGGLAPSSNRNWESFREIEPFPLAFPAATSIKTAVRLLTALLC